MLSEVKKIFTYYVNFEALRKKLSPSTKCFINGVKVASWGSFVTLKIHYQPGLFDVLWCKNCSLHTWKGIRVLRLRSRLLAVVLSEKFRDMNQNFTATFMLHGFLRFPRSFWWAVRTTDVCVFWYLSKILFSNWVVYLLNASILFLSFSSLRTFLCSYI
jgi:hypothetical protein